MHPQPSFHNWEVEMKEIEAGRVSFDNYFTLETAKNGLLLINPEGLVVGKLDSQGELTHPLTPEPGRGARIKVLVIVSELGLARSVEGEKPFTIRQALEVAFSPAFKEKGLSSQGVQVERDRPGCQEAKAVPSVQFETKQMCPERELTGDYLVELGGLKEGEGKYWVCLVNGRQTSASLSGFPLEDGDVVVCQLKEASEGESYQAK